jgi:uncharacterized RDD family membrane protein YckC
MPPVTEDAQFNPGAVPPSAPAYPTSALASPMSRFWASLIDGLILTIPLLLIVVAEVTSGASSFDGLLTQLASAAVEITYGGILLATSGRTLGMRALGIRVVSLASKERPTTGQAWLRTAAFSLPALIPTIGTFLNIIDCAWLLWDKPNRQTLHDKIAKTIVVADPVPLPAWPEA